MYAMLSAVPSIELQNVFVVNIVLYMGGWVCVCVCVLNNIFNEENGERLRAINTLHAFPTNSKLTTLLNKDTTTTQPVAQCHRQ